MDPILKTGTIIVNFALLSYTIAVISQYRSRKINKILLGFLTAGVLLDIIATAFMIIGSTNSPFTLHGFLGYSALLGMLIDMYLMWKVKTKNGMGHKINNKLHSYSLIAYSWWVIAYISGAVIIMMK